NLKVHELINKKDFECKAVYTNRGEQIETSLNKTNEVQGVSSVEEDDIKNEEKGVSGALPCQLPPKELNPGSFTLPYTIGSLNLYVMADLGASVNITPRLIFEHLNLVNLKKTNMLVKMADMTRKAPVGIIENVLVKINKFLFPFDFMIMDTIGETNETMILGRPFLATIHSQMDAFKREISLGIGEDRILFDMDGNVCHSRHPVVKTDFWYEEWLEIKLGHTNVSKSVRNAILNEWVLDSFDVEIDYGKTRDDPYSRRFDEYKEVFDNEIEQLGNEYDLRIGKKGYALDDVWEKCEIFHGGTVYPWHDEGFEEEERWKSGIEKTDYEQPFADIETFEIKRFSQLGRGVRGHSNSYSCDKKVSVWA
ncbi:phospholipase-like protein, partial [Tanacetum coccineum]